MKTYYYIFFIWCSFISNAQVGIGTTSPQEALHVVGGAIITDLQNSNTSSVLAAADGTLIKRNRILGKILPDGTSSKISGATCVRISTGNYQITFNTPFADSDYLILLSKKRLNENNHDDPNVAYYDQQVNGFKVEIENGDNGTTSGKKIDLEFMFRVEQID
jgi:hypothetical protein